VRLGLERLEAREVPAFSAGVFGGQLQVSLTVTGIDNGIFLDHSGNSTLVNGSPFDDARITRGISIRVLSDPSVGLSNVTIAATVKPVSVDGNHGLNNLSLGKNGSVQGIFGSVTVTGFDTSATLSAEQSQMFVDDSADPRGRNVTLSHSGGTNTISGLIPAPATITFDDAGLEILSISGGTGGNAFNILDTPHNVPTDGGGMLTSINPGGNFTTGSTVNVRRTFAGSLFVQGHIGVDRVNLGNAGRLQDIQGKLEIENANSFAALVLDDSADTVARTVRMSVPGAGVISGLLPQDLLYDPTHVSSLTVRGGNGGSQGNTFTIDDTAATATTEVDTGTSTDRVFVHNTHGPLTLNSRGAATINVGNGGRLLGIQGAIHITNPPSRSSLTIDGSADNVTRTFDLSATTTLGVIAGLGGGASIFYVPNDISQIHLIGGQGNETFLVHSTAPPAPITIDGLGRTTNFNVGNIFNSLDDIHSTLNLHGGAGFDALFVHDEGSTTGHFYGDNGSQITRDSVTINYSLMNIHQLFRSTAPIRFGPDPGFPAATDLALSDSIRAGQRATLSGRLIDDNPDQVLSLTVVWGDGSAPDEMTPDRAPFRLTHRYEAPGTYKVLVIWTDSLGQSNFQDLTLTVLPARHGGHGEHDGHDGHDGHGEHADHDADGANRLDAFLALLGNHDHHER
jgi:hypothetical protein